MADKRTNPPRPKLDRGVALVPEKATGACPSCQGLTRIAVLTPQGTAGYLVSEHLWSDEIPDDPAEHPTTAHYQVEWHVESVEGAVLGYEVVSLYYAAKWLARYAEEAVDVPQAG